MRFAVNQPLLPSSLSILQEAAVSHSALASSVPVVVIGGGQAGLSMSHELSSRGVEHVVIEKNRIAHAWRAQRWDAFCLVTPNWQCQLPGHPYDGPEPHGFMGRDEIVAYVEAYARKTGAPIHEGVAATRIGAVPGGGFRVETSRGTIAAKAVVLAIGGYHVPKIPAVARRLTADVVQIHSSSYRHPDQLPSGSVLVVGSGQSGCQIAEDLHLAGRKVHLVVGSAPRCPRVYRGRDAVDWLADLGHYDLPIDRHPLKEGVRKKANHYLTGRGGGRDIDLRRFALEGMVLHGRLVGGVGERLSFADDLEANLDAADAVYNGICELIDRHIADAGLTAPAGGRYEPVWRPEGNSGALDLKAAGIGAIVWTTGFRADWSFVELPVLDDAGELVHQRGVTRHPGLYALGLPWLHTWGSGRFLGVGRDAAFLGERIADHLLAGTAAAGALVDA